MKFNKHILLLTPGFPEDENDTTCIPPLQAYVNRFTQTHPEIKLSIITFQYPFFYKKYKWNNVEVYACGGKNRKLPYKLVTWKKVLRFFKQINKSNPVDLIHSFWLFDCAMIGNYLAKKNNLHSIITLMGQDAKPDNKYLRWINLNKCTTICLSINHKSIFKNTSGISNSLIIPWGIEPSDFPITYDPQKPIDIIGVGSFIELKNYSLFIKIIEQLKVSQNNIRAMLIGGGVQQEILEEEIRLKGLEENIQILEQLPRFQTLEWMSKSKILLHTSVYESQAYVFYEALQLGLKIVSFDVGVASPSPNWIVVKDEIEMQSGIKQILKDTSEKEIERPPLIGETVEKYYKLIEEIIQT